MTGDLYRRIIESFTVGTGTPYYPGSTCNIFAADVCDACETPLPRTSSGLAYTCNNILPELRNNYLSWRKSGTDGKSFVGAQLAANTGRTAVAITYDHIAIVRPNSTGLPPESITDVCLAQAGASPSTNTTLNLCWSADRHNEIEFYIWQGYLMSNEDAEEYLSNKGA